MGIPHFLTTPQLGGEARTSTEVLSEGKSNFPRMKMYLADVMGHDAMGL